MKRFLAVHMKAVAWTMVGLIAIGAVWYIVVNREPILGTYMVSSGSVAGSLNEPGIVTVQNDASLAFQESGQIAHVYVREGDAVTAGEVLADLNLSTLRTGVAQASAALAAAQAKLAELQTGATTQQIAVSQTALNSAQQAIANTYTSIPNTANDAYAKANDAVRNQLAPFFANAEQDNPQLTFQITDANLLNSLQSSRLAASTELNAWQTELASTTVNASDATLDGVLADAAKHLGVIQNLMQLVNVALTEETGLNATTLATYKTMATMATTEINEAITEVTGAQQAIASENAAIAQAQAGLALTTASSTPQEIDAQEATVAQAQAAASAAQLALDNGALTAPFSGTVQNLTAQVGQVVSPSAPVAQVVSNGDFTIQAYVSELDVAKVAVGDSASVTLDAFGNGTAFPATVTAIDSAQTAVNGVPSYLVTLHFINAEPQVTAGMTGNVNIVLTEASNTIAIPSRLILNDGNQDFVLLKKGSAIVRQPVQIGIVGGDGMTEIESGLTNGDTLANY